MKLGIPTYLLFASALMGSDRTVDPTFLHRNLATVPEKTAALTTATGHYKPVFGEGDPDRSALVGIARFGEATIDPNGSCAIVRYTDEDQVYIVLEGSGLTKYQNENVPLRKRRLFVHPCDRATHVKQSF